MRKMQVGKVIITFNEYSTEKQINAKKKPIIIVKHSNDNTIKKAYLIFFQAGGPP